MAADIILASTSVIRQDLLRRAGVDFTAHPARVDEAAIRDAMLAEGARPRDIADALAETKSRKLGQRHPDAVVIGCDQVLDLGGVMFTKPEAPDMARDQLARLGGQTHHLFSAAVIYHQGAPIWRHIGQARMVMRDLSPGYIADYVARNWDSIRHSVGCYKIEEEGIRLFSDVQGSTFVVQGLPLVEILAYLTQRGDLPG